MTQVWSSGIIAQQKRHTFEPLEVSNKAGVGVHEMCQGEHVREEEQRVEGPALSGSTMPEYNAWAAGSRGDSRGSQENVTRDVQLRRARQGNGE